MVHKFQYQALAIFSIFWAFILMFSISGLVSAQEQYPDMSGRWEINSMISFDQDKCRSTPYQERDRILLTIFVSQNEENLEITADPFNTPEDQTFRNVYFNMSFFDTKNLYGNAQYRLDIGRLNLTFSNIVLSEDCDDMRGNIGFIYYEESDERHTCTGYGKFTGRKLFPTGCGFECEENWVCSDWSVCVNGSQTRLCEDKNYCMNDSSRPLEMQDCEIPLPAPAEPKGSIWIYIIIILAILIAAASTIILRMKLKERKKIMLENLNETINEINNSIDKGDRLGAMNWYKTFGEMFEKYREYIKEEDYNRLYGDVLRAYQRIIRMGQGF